MKKTDKSNGWVDEFDNEFNMYDFRGDWASDSSKKTILKQINKKLALKIDRAYQLGYKKSDDEQEVWLEEQKEEEAHRTEEGYCCACNYDMAVMADKIDKKVHKERMRLIGVYGRILRDSIKEERMRFVEMLEDEDDTNYAKRQDGYYPRRERVLHQNELRRELKTKLTKDN